MNHQKIEALRVAAMVAVGTGQLNTENERTLYEAAEAVAKMQTDAQRTDLIVKAITTTPRFGSGYAWHLRFGVGMKGWLSVGSWPRQPEGLAFIKKKMGLDLIPTYKEMQDRGKDDSGLVKQWVRDKVAALPRLTRGEYLARMHKISGTGGMGAQRITAELSLKFDPPPRDEHGNPNYSMLVGAYVDVTVKWWGDGSMTIESEDVGKDGDLYSLYQWEGCEHSFKHKLISNCYHGYTCEHCGHHYTIDSGD